MKTLCLLPLLAAWLALPAYAVCPSSQPASVDWTSGIGKVCLGLNDADGDPLPVGTTAEGIVDLCGMTTIGNAQTPLTLSPGDEITFNVPKDGTCVATATFDIKDAMGNVIQSGVTTSTNATFPGPGAASIRLHE